MISAGDKRKWISIIKGLLFSSLNPASGSNPNSCRISFGGEVNLKLFVDLVMSIGLDRIPKTSWSSCDAFRAKIVGYPLDSCSKKSSLDSVRIRTAYRPIAEAVSDNPRISILFKTEIS